MSRPAPVIWRDGVAKVAMVGLVGNFFSSRGSDPTLALGGGRLGVLAPHLRALAPAGREHRGTGAAIRNHRATAHARRGHDG